MKKLFMALHMQVIENWEMVCGILFYQYYKFNTLTKSLFIFHKEAHNELH